MISVLLDACVPRRLRQDLSADFVVATAQDLELDELKDGPLLDAIDGKFDVLVTRDRNLQHQQRISGRSIAVIVIRTKDQSPTAFAALVPELKVAIEACAAGTVTVVGG
jgi:predicted nuclease of predicted toxin-antitoxin system